MKHGAQDFNDIIVCSVPHNPVMLTPFLLHLTPEVHRGYGICQGHVVAQKVVIFRILDLLYPNPRFA